MPSKEDRDLIVKLAVKCVYKDVSSFESVCGEGFCDLAQSLFDICAYVGCIDATKLLPAPIAVS